MGTQNRLYSSRFLFVLRLLAGFNLNLIFSLEFFASFMKPKKRKSQVCHNCDTTLSEDFNFCPSCGQSNTDNNVTFWVLIKEFVDNYLGIDSKMAHSFMPFLLRPGKLTNRFQAGQIKNFIHPIRLYFVLSLFYFFIISYLLGGINFSALDDEQANFGGDAKLESFLDNDRLKLLSDSVKIALVPDSLKNSFSSIKNFRQLYDSLERQFDDNDDEIDDFRVSLQGVPVPESEGETFFEKAHRLARDKRNITDQQFMDSLSNSGNNFDGDFFSGQNRDHINQQVRKIFENDEGFKSFVLGNLPLMMFVLIPLFAGVLKLIYIRRKHLYIKHVVHALHVHAFAYFMYGIALLIMFKLFTPEVFPNMDHTTWRWILMIIFFVGVSTYVYVSFLKVYQQHWFKTLLKFNIVGVIYGFFLNAFFFIELYISFWYY